MLVRGQIVKSILFLLVLNSVALADRRNQGNETPTQVPTCLGVHDEKLDLNPADVMEWKHSSKNQYHNRGHLKGNITKLYDSKNGHRHFEITFNDDRTQDTIEIIYNEDFGQLPQLELGESVEACGDYITSTAPSGPYPASPNGAILHWVHNNPSGKGHPPGYLVISNVLYGYNMSGVKLKPRRP